MMNRSKIISFLLAITFVGLFNIVGMFNRAANEAKAQSTETLNKQTGTAQTGTTQAEVFLPFVASSGLEVRETLSDEDTPHVNTTGNRVEAQAMGHAGEVTSTSIELRTDIPLEDLDPDADWAFSTERKMTNRLLIRMGDRYDYMPEAMGFSVSNFGSETPTMFVAATLGKADIKYTHQAGLLIQSEWNPATNQFDIVADREFPECEELAGVQSSSDGMVVAVLCKTFNKDGATRTDFTKDLIANFGSDNGMADATLPDHGHYDMWLYEWTGDDTTAADITTDPNKFIVHTSQWKKDGLPHSFVYGEEDDTYAISVSQRVKGKHQNDSLYIVQRAETPENYKIVRMHRGMANNDLRGWQNSCSAGHPYLISVSFNPITNEYSVLCSSEANNQEAGADIGGINLARGNIIEGENNEKENFLLLQRDGPNRMKGGSGALLPLGNGWIGIVIGADAERSALDGKSASPATQVGLVQFGQNGEVIAQPDSNPDIETVGEGVHWVETPAAYANHYVSYPQLVPLDAANGTYLLGYGIMPATGDSTKDFAELGWKLNFPMKYFVQEIEITCADSTCTTPATIRPLTAPKELSGVGWGMIDQMVPLGIGQVGWATYEMDKMTIGPNANEWSQPNAFTKKLQFNLYESASE